MRSVLGKIAESLEGTVSLNVESVTDQFSVLAEDHARVDPGVWERAGRAINQRERLRLGYQRFDGVRGHYEVESGSGCGTRASGCASGGTAAWKCASPPQGARN